MSVTKILQIFLVDWKFYLVKKEISNLLPSGKLSPQLAISFKEYIIDKIGKIMRIFQNYYKSEDFFLRFQIFF